MHGHKMGDFVRLAKLFDAAVAARRLRRQAAALKE
jgi:hypothetical protein